MRIRDSMCVCDSGVARTTPQSRFFKDNADSVAFYKQVQEDPLYNMTSDAVARMHARFSILNHLAAENTMDVSPYLSTASVTRDMLSIVKAHGRTKLQYWGFS